MQEKDIFDEKQEVKKASFVCPQCRERNEYDVRWLKRTKNEICRATSINKNAHNLKNRVIIWCAWTIC